MTVEEVVGCLKTHEERMRGQSENVGCQLLLTQEEWLQRSGKTETGNQRYEDSVKHHGRERSSFRSGNGGRGQQSQMKNSGHSKGTIPGRDGGNVNCIN